MFRPTWTPWCINCAWVNGTVSPFWSIKFQFSSVLKASAFSGELYVGNLKANSLSEAENLETIISLDTIMLSLPCLNTGLYRNAIWCSPFSNSRVDVVEKKELLSSTSWLSTNNSSTLSGTVNWMAALAEMDERRQKLAAKREWIFIEYTSS